MGMPVIGITAEAGRFALFAAQSRDATVIPNLYLEPIIEAGGLPVVLSPVLPTSGAAEVVQALDGLLLTGGPDLHPQTYGQELRVHYSKDVEAFGELYSRPIALAPNPRRDAFELAMYGAAKKKRIPIFGLCRGMHVINVAEGGTLMQEIDGAATIIHEFDTEGYVHHHPVQILAGTVMHRLFEADSYVTPSLHHQAIDRLAENLIASGVAEDGIIEFIESQEPGQLIIGMQGHIERARLSFSKFKYVFAQFVDACRSKTVAQ